MHLAWQDATVEYDPKKCSQPSLQYVEYAQLAVHVLFPAILAAVLALSDALASAVALTSLAVVVHEEEAKAQDV